MLKLAKFLKPFLLLVIVAIVLLFAQAMCDLNLPNYMSDIVNVGIQQSGIEHVTPEAISKNGFILMTSFMSDEQKEVVQKNYELMEKTDDNISKYPLLETEEVYALKNKDKEVYNELDSIFSEATLTFTNTLKTLTSGETKTVEGEQTNWTVITVLQDIIEKSTEKNAISSDTNMVDLNEVYNKVLPMLTFIPKQNVELAREQALGTEPQMQKQIGIAFTKEFYEEVGVNVGKIQNNYIMKIGGLMLLIALAGGIATIAVGYISARVAAGVAKNLRKTLFEKIEGFGILEFNKFGASSLITRTTNDITQIQTLLSMGIRMICYAPLMAIGGIIMALNKSTSMIWVIALSCIVLLGIIVVMFVMAMPRFKLIQKLIDKLNLVARENLNGLSVIRAFGNQKYEGNRFDMANKDVTKTNLFINRIMSFMMPAMTFIMSGTTLLVIWVGAHQVANSALQIGDMMAFMSYAMQIIMSFLMIAMMFILVPRASVSAMRIDAVLKTNNSVKNLENPKHLTRHEGLIEFKNVGFNYDNADEKVLSDISFIAHPRSNYSIYWFNWLAENLHLLT